MKYEPYRVAEFVKCFCEYQDIINFVKNEDVTEKIILQQLRCLWTAFCIRYDGMVDTGTYDSEFNELYDVLIESCPALPDNMKDKEEFYNFMCEFMC